MIALTNQNSAKIEWTNRRPNWKCHYENQTKIERQDESDDDQAAGDGKIEKSRTSKQRSSFEKSTSWFKEEVEMHWAPFTADE